jgi:hypothetical protein
VAAPLDLAGGANAGAVGIQQHPQQHPRRIGGAARIRNSLLACDLTRRRAELAVDRGRRGAQWTGPVRRPPQAWPPSCEASWRAS